MRFATSWWAGQLSTTRATFLPSRSNFRSFFLTHSSKSWLSIQLLFCAQYLQGKFRTPLKHLGFCDLPITNMGSFSPAALAAASPVRLVSPGCLVRLCKIGQTHRRGICREGRTLREALEASRRVDSFQEAVISKVQDCASPKLP